MTKPRHTLRRGFSLMETLVAIMISMLVAGSIVSLMVGQMRATSTLNRNMLNEQTLRDNLVYMTDEINSMGNNGEEPFMSEATVDQLEFSGDVDNDGDLDLVEYIYDEDAAELTRTLSSTDDGGATWDEVATDVLIPNVEEFEFTYFTTGNVESADVDLITAVQIRCKLDTAAGATEFNQGKIAVEEQVTRVTIRNRTLD